jgi:uncharacterized membrane protein YozB (DUF420 family)
MKEFLAKPGFLGTYGTVGADVTFLLAIVFTTLFLTAWHVARKHQGNRHHIIILWGALAMLVYFSSYYLTRGLGVLAIEGREGFGGPDWFYNYVFSPVLTAHILLVSLCLVMAVYMIILGFRASSKESGRRLLKGSELKVNKRNFYTALSVILVVLGLFALIRCGTLRCVSVYGAGLIIVSLTFLLERIIEKVCPKAADRHRLVGRYTMVMFLMAMITSVLIYLSLYTIYQPRLS